MVRVAPFFTHSVCNVHIVGVSACVIFILLQKTQKMLKCTFWYRLNRVVPDKVQRAVKWLCCACVFVCNVTGVDVDTSTVSTKSKEEDADEAFSRIVEVMKSCRQCAAACTVTSRRSVREQVALCDADLTPAHTHAHTGRLKVWSYLRQTS